MTSHHDLQYLDLVHYILANGVRKPNRTGVDTIGVFAYQLRFDLRDGTIPLLTTKKVHIKSIVHELLWMLSGSTNIKYLKDNGVTIWDAWADERGELGPVYGSQWREWPRYTYIPDAMAGFEWVPSHYQVEFVDQIQSVVSKLQNNPTDRRMIVSCWNVADLNEMKLPPCHYAFQLYTRPLTTPERLAVSKCNPDDLWHELNHATPATTIEAVMDEAGLPKYELTLMVNQRSCDVGLGVPFNIVQYAFLLRMLCEVSNMTPGELIWSGGDVHIYDNHIEALKEQCGRPAYASPTFKFTRPVTDIDDFKYEDFVVEDYNYHPAIKMEVAV